MRSLKGPCGSAKLLDVRCGLSVQSRHAIERGELDLALFKREAGERGGIASWPERLHWVTSKQHPVDYHRDPLPLVMADQGCLYRNRMIHAIEAAGRSEERRVGKEGSC